MPIPTFLLDLDNTLLGNPMEKFLPAYITSLEPFLRPLLNGNNLQHMLFGSVQRITATPNPQLSLFEAFMADFSARLNQSPADIKSRLDAYYQTEYPRLKVHTSLRPTARKLVERLLTAGCTVVVATNPLFPEVAIRQRLAWAGLADIEFGWITTMENSYYAKPHPRYFQAALAAVGGHPAAAWMVGDEWELDIAPTLKLGLQTWWITDHLPATPTAPPDPRALSGSLAQVLAWVENQPFATAG